jgi:hypothetical protein
LPDHLPHHQKISRCGLEPQKKAAHCAHEGGEIEHSSMTCFFLGTFYRRCPVRISYAVKLLLTLQGSIAATTNDQKEVNMKSQIAGIVNQRLCVLLLTIAAFVSAGVVEGRAQTERCTNGYSGPFIGNGQITFGGNTACNYETGIGTTAKLCYRFNGRRLCVYEVWGSNYGYTNSVRTTIPCQQSGTVEYFVIVTSNVAAHVRSPLVRSEGC